MAAKLCLKVCQHFQPEMMALRGGPEFANCLSSTYPSFCEHPQKDHGQWQQMIMGQAEAGDQVVIVGGCFLDAAQNFPAAPNLRISRVDQCFYLFAGQSLIDHYMRQGAYLLTPGWLEDWPLRMARLGFDPITAQQFFGECATKLVLLDTGVNCNSALQLQDLAAYLNLPAETVPIGLDYFRQFMRQLILEWRQDQSIRESRAALAVAKQKVADYAMALDLLANLAGMRTEAEVVVGILDLFTMLFAPNRLVYVPVSDGQLGKPQVRPVSDTVPAALPAWLESDFEDDTWLPEKNGFHLRITYQAATVGLLEVAEVAFPENTRQYLNLAASMASVCGMAVVNARLFQQVQHSANTDALTGLPNRRFFFHLAGVEWARAQRYGRPLSAIMFDIDHFKQVNDVYGHAAGDQVLVSVVDRCRSALRTSDVLGRYGGEEFIVLLPETALPKAHQLAERLRNSIAAAPFESDGHTLAITISLGVGALDIGCTSLDALVRRCDEALYRAKANSRNQTQAWEA